MKKLLFIIAFTFCISAKAQDIVFYNDTSSTALNIMANPPAWVDLTDSNSVRQYRVQAYIKIRRKKVDAINALAILRLSQANLETFLTDTRNAEADYIYGSSTFATWLQNTFPTKAYYNVNLRRQMAIILNSNF